MTLLQLVKHLRVSMLDDTGGHGVDWESIAEDDVEAAQLRWTNEELSAFISEAERIAAASALLLRKSESSFNISVTSGTAEYDLDPKILKLKGVELDSNGRNLIRAEYEDFRNKPRWRDVEGTPTHYVVDENDTTILLYPKPVIDDTLHLVYNRLPLNDLSWDNPNSSPEIPEQYQVRMLDYAAYLAYMKDEANTFDPSRAASYKGLFESNFSISTPYSETRRKQTRNRAVRYRDLL